MQITIIAVGKIKESFYKAALSEYEKRLSRYCKFKVIEVEDEKTPERVSSTEKLMILNKEAQRILKRIKEDALLYTLEISGKRLDSPAFSGCIQEAALSGKSHIQFVIGGSLGLCESVSACANGKISFSDLTFPHQLMRVILAEQIYRSYRIINGEPYHK